MFLASLAAVTLGAAIPPTAKVRCSLRRPAACRNTNELVWDKEFQRQISAFVGKAQTNAFGNGDELLLGNMVDTLGGPPDDVVRLPDGNYLFTACMAHICPEKGAVVLTPNGSIVAAAMLTYHYAHENDSKWRGADIPYSRLDIYIRSSMKGNPAWRAAIVSWAKAAYVDNHSIAGEFRPGLGLTERIWLIRPISPRLQRLGFEKIA